MSDLAERRPQWVNHAWPLTRDLSAGRLRKEIGRPRRRLCLKATLSVVSGVKAIVRLCSHFVSIAEVDKRRVVFTVPG